MTDSKALIERLRQLSGNTGKMTWVGDKPMTASDALTRAADYIEKLEADNARLQGLLRESEVKLTDVQGAYAAKRYADNLLARISAALQETSQ